MEMKLDLGCGPAKEEGYIGIDIIPFNRVDCVWDLNNGIPFNNNVFDSVKAYDAIEHVRDGINLMREIWRVLKGGGVFDCHVPSTDGRGAFQDLTHVSYWNENSFWYYWANAQEWPDYGRRECLFEAIELYTTPMSQDGVCHVIFKGKAVKTGEWLDTYNERTKNQPWKLAKIDCLKKN